ncbi:23S rRNA (guanosine(2251)-2'-O)-methyltransferase RlmB [Allomuricauda sp. d1]|uniref:23S rRNA (guanosine(2251)-2'-O)-methyltransferase RlmB n=1 Tax=Allomuricauda sp. d1 TaxID=3136725 RepID=UPI0031DEFB85
MSSTNQVYGLRAIIEALHAKKSIHKIYLQRGLQGDLYNELKQLAASEGIGVSTVPKEKLNRLTKGNHQGAIAQISPIAFKDFSEFMDELQQIDNPFLLMLDGISDVRNFGAIIRTAECTGANGIIIPKNGAAPINDITVKTSAGAAFNVPIVKVDHLKDAIYFLQSMGIKTIAATEKTSTLIYKTDFSTPCAIIMGSEDKGVTPSILKIVDEQVKLPMRGKIESLNVSVACGAVLYEALRQRLGQSG